MLSSGESRRALAPAEDLEVEHHAGPAARVLADLVGRHRAEKDKGAKQDRSDLDLGEPQLTASPKEAGWLELKRGRLMRYDGLQTPESLLPLRLSDLHKGDSHA